MYMLRSEVKCLIVIILYEFNSSNLQSLKSKLMLVVKNAVYSYLNAKHQIAA